MNKVRSKDGTTIAQSIKNADAFSSLVRNTLKPLTPEFFQGWTITGFDGSKGAREDLEEAIRMVLEGEETPASLKKKKHRLFKEAE